MRTIVIALFGLGMLVLPSPATAQSPEQCPNAEIRSESHFIVISIRFQPEPLGGPECAEARAAVQDLALGNGVSYYTCAGARFETGAVIRCGEPELAPFSATVLSLRPRPLVVARIDAEVASQRAIRRRYSGAWRDGYGHDTLCRRASAPRLACISEWFAGDTLLRVRTVVLGRRRKGGRRPPHSDRQATSHQHVRGVTPPRVGYDEVGASIGRCGRASIDALFPVPVLA